MTNYEIYKNEIEKYTRLGLQVSFSNNQIRACSAFACSKCEFNNDKFNDDLSCMDRLVEWMDKEYNECKPKIDWSKVPVDTLVLVKSPGSKDWVKRYFAKYESDKVYTFKYGATSATGSLSEVSYWEYAKLYKEEK